MATKKKPATSNPNHERTMSPFQHIAHLVRTGADTKTILNYARAMSRAALEVDEESGYLPQVHYEAIGAVWALTLALARAEAESDTLRKRLSRTPKRPSSKSAGELMKKNGAAYPAQNGVSAPPSVFAPPSE